MTQAASTRERIIVAASALTTEEGWAAVTMARLADRVGVSRQTVYNEVGSKPALAEAMVLTELSRFLDVVDQAFTANPGNLLESIRAAARGVLEMAPQNPLLRAVVAGSHGADVELLPLLTTHAEPLLTTAKEVLKAEVAPYQLPFDEFQLDAVVDQLVRVVLSHVMQPSDTPANTADRIVWIAERVLRD
ncbi:TetR/AcrR family transcriptional regulator [Nocardioides speluncae]|uniref:TetR/AcrR family transcriptional regulator n=1 Tax=Nocardioides speluncae TaxID=2670337 RepID=UPI000D695D9E|nr:TetR family transcriptional regulator [Nocardioides speluncae]